MTYILIFNDIFRQCDVSRNCPEPRDPRCFDIIQEIDFHSCVCGIIRFNFLQPTTDEMIIQRWVGISRYNISKQLMYLWSAAATDGIREQLLSTSLGCMYTFVRIIVTCVLSWTLHAVHNIYSNAGTDQVTIQFHELITNLAPVTAVGPEDCRNNCLLARTKLQDKRDEKCEVQYVAPNFQLAHTTK